MNINIHVKKVTNDPRSNMYLTVSNDTFAIHNTFFARKANEYVLLNLVGVSTHLKIMFRHTLDHFSKVLG